MKSFTAQTLARQEAGEIDYIDGLTFLFDSGAASLLIGTRGQFEWTDAQLGTQTFIGTGNLVSIEMAADALGPKATPISVRLTETYLPAGGDEPINVFDDGVRASIDAENWQGRLCVISSFWLDAGGDIIERETIDIRQIDMMPTEVDANGNPYRIAVLERPEIRQRDIAGKMRNAEFQSLIDPTDKSFEHVGATARQKITFGRRAEGTVT